MFPIKHLILIPILFLLAILQISFLSHFTMQGAGLNLVFIAVFLLSFFETKESFSGLGLFAGFTGGLFLDIFSSAPFGAFALLLALLSFLIKKLANVFQKSNILSFSLLFLFSFLFYKVFFCFLHFYSLHWLILLIEFFYNFSLALLGFAVLRSL